jgi:hypothetical protein
MERLCNINFENELKPYKANIHCKSSQAQGGKAQTVYLVRQAAVNAVIVNSCIEDLAPVEFIAQHIKITILARMQQSDVFRGTRDQYFVSRL